MTGSADIFEHHRRTPRASINHVTVHDGFTLADLVSYERKHNEANREDNRDGSDFNFSINCGVEGPTDDAEIVALRQQLRRNLLPSLLLAHGVPLYWRATKSATARPATTTPIARTTRSAGSIGPALDRDGEDMTGAHRAAHALTPALSAASGTSLAQRAPPGRKL